MRTNDITQLSKPVELERTRDLYLPARLIPPMTVEELTVSDLRKGLCAKAAGNVNICRSCSGGCRWGMELVRRVDANPIHS